VADLDYKLFIPFASALAGASAAFGLGLVKQWRDKKDERHTALLETQYALYSQFAVLDGIRKSLLEPLRNDPRRYQTFQVFFLGKAHLPVPLKDLTFLIDSDEPNLLQEIHLAETACTGVLDILKRLNEAKELILKEAKPRTFDMTTGKAAIEVRAELVFSVKSLLDLLYSETDKALPRFNLCVEKIHKFVKRNYRWKKAVPSIKDLPKADE
jgi:hypothetical protein